MDEEDFRALIEIVEKELRDVGLGEIADPAHYLVANPETGDVQLLEPKKRLIEMLDALDSAMAIRDRETYTKAMASLTQVTRGEGPKDAVYVPTSDEGHMKEISLSDAPELSNIRSEIKAFIERLDEPEPDPWMAP